MAHDASRGVRFEEANAVRRVAAVCGYADQSHLTREFSRFAGTTPAMAQRLAP